MKADLPAPHNGAAPLSVPTPIGIPPADALEYGQFYTLDEAKIAQAAAWEIFASVEARWRVVEAQREAAHRHALACDRKVCALGGRSRQDERGEGGVGSSSGEPPANSSAGPSRLEG